jgi:DNA-binding NarL/FixJ family response regulator
VKKIRILIVEDEIIIAWDLKRRLERLDSEVIAIADSAEAAVELVRSDSPDLILMDITLKGPRTGIDAALDIRRFSETAIVYLTGNTHLADAPAIAASRAQGMYAKPPSEAQIKAMLQAANSDTVHD